MPAHAQRQFDYCAQARSTAATLDCVNRQYGDTQEALSILFSELSAAQSDEARTLLGAAQKNWILYRDEQCGWEAGLAETEALRRIYELSCLTALTERRTTLLRSIMAQQKEGAPREFGAQPRWMNALAHDYPDIFWRYGESLTADLDCDGEDEQILRGLAVSPMQESVTIGENGVAESVRNDLEIVIAVSDNPVAGRPRARLFRIPVHEPAGDPAAADGHENAVPHICRVRVAVNLLNDRRDDAAETGNEQCAPRLRIADRICTSLTLFWNGEAYVLEPEQAGEAL